MSERTAALTFASLIKANNISDPLALDSGVVADKVDNKKFFIHVIKLTLIILFTAFVLHKLPARRTVVQFPASTENESEYRINLTEVNPLNRKLYVYI